MAQSFIEFNGGREFDGFGMFNSGSNGSLFADLGDGGSLLGMGNALEFENSYASTTTILSGDGDLRDDISVTGGGYQLMIVDAGEGENNMTLTGAFIANAFEYEGGTDADTVVFDASTSTDATIAFTMGRGVDNLDIKGTEFVEVDVNMEDTLFSSTFAFETFTHEFNNQVNNFPISILNWNGFSHEFDNGQLVSVQNIITPDLTLRGQNGFTRFKLNGHPTMDLMPTDSFTLEMLDDSGTNVKWAIPTQFSGDVGIRLGDGNRELTQDGEFFADVIGQFNLSGGEGNQSAPSFMGRFGQLAIDLGPGFDRLEDVHFVDVAGRMNVTNVEKITTAGMPSTDTTRITVDGNLSIDNRQSEIAFNVITVELNNIEIGGNFSYFGSDVLPDNLAIRMGEVGGGVYVSLADDHTVLSSLAQSFSFAGGTIGGNVTVLSNGESDATTTIHILHYHGLTPSIPLTVNGNSYLRPGKGDTRVFLGAQFGNVLSYRAHNSESVTSQFSLTNESPGTRVNAILGAGNENVYVSLAADQFEDLRIDFGGGDDQLDNQAARKQLNYKTRFLNFNGVSVFGLPHIDNTHVNQVGAIDPKLIIVATNSTEDNAPVWRIAGAEFSPSGDISVKMQDDSGTRLDMETDRQITGSVRPNLGNGDRFFFIKNNASSLSTPVAEALRVSAGTGEQLFIMSGNHFANGLRMLVDGGTGNDYLAFEAITDVGGGLILNGINQITVYQPVTVGFNMTVSTIGDDEGMNPGSGFGGVTVNNNYNFFGGNNNNNVRLHGYSILNDAYINLAGVGNDPNDRNSLRLESTDIGSLTVLSQSRQSDLFFESSSVVRDGIFANFTGSGSSIALLHGSVESGDVIFRGTEGDDEVEVSLNAGNSEARIFTYGGEDEVELFDESVLLSLRVDFGDDLDTFIDQFNGSAPFDVTLLNLP